MGNPEWEKEFVSREIAKHPALTDEQKIKMFDMIQYYCVLYGVKLFDEQDAEDFWEVLRYGQ